MDAVKEAQMEQRLVGLTSQFERAEERNREEQREMRAEFKGLRTEMSEGFRDLHRLLLLGMTSFIASVVAVIVAHSL